MYEFKLKKHYNTFKLDVSFNISDEETLVILGPSGCGKSTLLNLITGVVQMDEGSVKRNETALEDTHSNIHVPIYKRNIGYIQQKSNLFPHLSIMDNLTYAVKDKKSIKNKNQQLQKLIQIFQLEKHLHKRPNEISGGQQQRVAIVRALMSDPSLLLFDEPFSALDSPLRVCLREQIVKIKQTLRVPIIFVTHDLEEAYDIGDTIMIMNDGNIIEKGTRDKIFNTPKELTTARLIGVKNIWDAVVATCKNNMSIVNIGDVHLRINRSAKVGKKIKIGIKASDIVYMKDHKIDLEENYNRLEGKVLQIKRSYSGFLLTLKVDKLPVNIFLKLPEYVVHADGISIGNSITVCLKYDSLIMFG